MRRPITGFHQDDEGWWVAELSCLHGQHVRHQPPWQERPWVESEAGRANHLGAVLDCPGCDLAELPAGLHVVRTAGSWDETSIPKGLLRTHRVGPRTWGRLQVLEGHLGFTMATDPAIRRELHGGDHQAIPPEVEHEVTLVGPVRLEVDFLTG